jgi:hypothetical protein
VLRGVQRVVNYADMVAWLKYWAALGARFEAD